MAGTAGSRLRRVGAFLGGGAIVLLAFASCGGSSISPATVYVASTIGPSPKGTGNTTLCPQMVKVNQLDIGSADFGVPTGTASTTVVCSVEPSGSEFTVSINVISSGGSFDISGTMPASGTATGILGSLDNAPGGNSTGVYQDSNCSVTLVSTETANGPPIAPGRVWGVLTCDDATTEGQTGICETTFTFRMENCAGSPASS